jgi:hypothetical protein
VDAKEIMSRAQLYFLSYEAHTSESGVIIYSKKGHMPPVAEKSPAGTQEDAEGADSAANKEAIEASLALDSLDPAGLLQAVLSDEEKSSGADPLDL